MARSVLGVGRSRYLRNSQVRLQKLAELGMGVRRKKMQWGAMIWRSLWGGGLRGGGYPRLFFEKKKKFTEVLR